MSLDDSFADREARPVPSTLEAVSSPSSRENFLNRWGRRSGDIPGPASATEMRTWKSSFETVTVTGDDSGECWNALEKRLLRTWTIR